jgi:hypothetical protein
MGEWIASVSLKAMAAVACFAAVVWLALWYFIPAPPSTITFASGIKGGNFEHIAKRYQESLALHVSRSTCGQLRARRKTSGSWKIEIPASTWVICLEAKPIANNRRG